MSVLAACIDVTGSKRAMDVAYCKDGMLELMTMPSVPRFCAWIIENRPRIIAVDAPSKKNCGRVAQTRTQYGVPVDKYENFRVAEALLRIRGIGLYNTPVDDPPQWMKRGWGLYESLTSLSYRLLDSPGSCSIAPDAHILLEVHPHASFVVGLGWIPQSKLDLAGQIERLAYLRGECEQLGVNAIETQLGTDPLELLRGIQATWGSILTNGLTLPTLSHDQLDAVVGMTTALRAIRGEAWAVGDSADGVIVLPRRLSPTSYCSLQAA